MIRHYTREAGVRNLEREIATVCRKQARRIAEGKPEKLLLTPDNLRDFLGIPRYRLETEIVERTRQPGVMVGLAWTPTGGDVLYVEANAMKGSKGFTMTGHVGQVMQESMQAALAWVRSHAADYDIDPGLLPVEGYSHSRSVRGHSQRRTLGGRHHGFRPGLRPYAAAFAAAARHDRRNYAERTGAARGRHQGEGAGGQTRGRDWKSSFPPTMNPTSMRT